MAISRMRKERKLSLAVEPAHRRAANISGELYDDHDFPEVVTQQTGGAQAKILPALAHRPHARSHLPRYSTENRREAAQTAPARICSTFVTGE